MSIKKIHVKNAGVREVTNFPDNPYLQFPAIHLTHSIVRTLNLSGPYEVNRFAEKLLPGVCPLFNKNGNHKI
jgi:hypothetical protein